MALAKERVSIAALEREIAALAAVLEQVLPPVQVPIITSHEEARAIGQFLLAHSRGEADAFRREQRLGWQLVKRVLGRIEHVISGDGVGAQRRVYEEDGRAIRRRAAGAI